MPTQVTKLNLNGINTDISAYESPQEVWTGGHNIVFDNNQTRKTTGTADVFGTTGSGNPPHWLLPFSTSTDNYWLYPTLTKIRKLSGSTHTDVTRQTGGDYTASAASWNGGVLGGVAVLNNGSDVPQQYGSNATHCSDLSNWVSTTRARVIRPFKEFLIAMNTTESSNSTRYPFRVRWSTPADAGTVPTSWDDSVATNDAGFVDLSQTGGFVVDSLPLKDINIVYKEDSVYSMSFIGGAFIFSFSQLFSDAGMLVQGCAGAFDDKHFVVGTDDVYVHNGQTKQSVIAGVVKDDLFGSISSEFYKRTFVVPNYKNNEMWVCFPSLSSSGAVDTAFIWNYRTNVWSKRDLPDVSYIGWGVVDDSGSYVSSYDADTGSWDSDDTGWGFRGYNPTQSSLLMAVPSSNKFCKLGTHQASGSSYLAWVEKTGMSLGTTLNKHVQRIVPSLSGTGGVDVYVGTENSTNEGVSWKGPYTITPGVHSDIPVRASGKYISVKFQTQDDKDWALDNLEIHWKPAGNRGNSL